ncbi:glycoside hydrolase family 88/105 protein [Aquisalinus flavus]|uniref:Glycosyl hydrolase family 88 n=1 Tax=Aquisalinus flavus TaxID=1526572 RepID=A0A8J2Y6M6_9PROT|nr:glycoside hydrolase family 88 protein [Aquisalinus flavus]MBD0425955.1 glycoside hydrolase family 88 protein [Aquisalinus flavus]UNE48452.1 glycoside hydrolase family 105 protein [Aquisalinus flavus]GGD11895.1 glycosyl hydrolase family 88 [Aquisalinus flavus]
MPNLVHSIERATVTDAIGRLIDNLLTIKDETGEFLLHLEDGRIIDTKGWSGWEWTHGVGLFGLWNLYQQNKDPKILAIIQGWFADRFAEGTATKNINTVAPFLTLANMYDADRDLSHLPYLDTWAEWVMHGLPRTEEGGFQHVVYNDINTGEIWADTLMMSALPLARIGQVIDRPHYIEEAKRQFLLHTKYLCDTETGLWFHGWTFLERHNFARARWARGNCWITIAIPEIIEMLDLKPGDHFREFLLETLLSQVKALANHQHESGLWHTLIDDPSSYLEASATAGFAYGILKGVRKHYLPAEFEDIGIAAIRGILENIDDAGELQQVSFGTDMGDDLQFYRDIPLTSMPYGQSLAMCALGEFLRKYI